MGLLTPQAVDEILRDVLGDDLETCSKIEMVINTYLFDLSRVEARREDICILLGELHEEFMDDGGGGWSFLNICEDRHGTLWTGVHETCEQLLALGAALDLVDLTMFRRELWSALPGGVPYVQVKRSKFKEEEVAPT